MTRTEYIRRTIAACIGTSRPASPHLYWSISAMADRAATVYQFDPETQKGGRA